MTHAFDWAVEDQTRLLAVLLRRSAGQTRASEIAGDLVAHFGSLPAVLAADRSRLSERGLGPAAISFLRSAKELTERVAKSRIPLTQPLLTSHSELLDYLNATMANHSREVFRVLYLDTRIRLIADEVLHEGTVNHVTCYPREVLRRTLELHAMSMILVHNHPTGDPAPSSSDVILTKKIIEAARPLGIVVHDHLIVSRSGHTSLRAAGLI